jgi:hypothetical protein
MRQCCEPPLESARSVPVKNGREVRRRRLFVVLKNSDIFFLQITTYATVPSSPFSAPGPLMAKSSKKPRRQGPPAPLAELVARNAARNGGSEGADPRAADQRALGRAAPPASSRRRARCWRRVWRPTEGKENFPPRKALKSHETRKSSAPPVPATDSVVIAIARLVSRKLRCAVTTALGPGDRRRNCSCWRAPVRSAPREKSSPRDTRSPRGRRP